MKQTKIWLWAVLLGLLAFTACTELNTPIAQPVTTPVSTNTPEPPTATPSPTPEPQAALVNGQPLLLADYEREVALYAASMAAAGQDVTTPEGQAALAQGRELVLEMLINQLLIEQAANAAGVTVSDEELDATIATLRAETGEEAFQQWLVDQGMSLEDFRKRLRSDTIATRMANRAVENVPTHAEHVHARHILANTEAEARQILSQLQAGGDFVSLARTYSQDVSTRDTGGDLGFFPKGILTAPEVEAAAFALQPGQISDVIQSSMGYHIVQVLERVPDMEIDPENLRLLREKASREWIEELRAAANIQRFVSFKP
ncbi:MAG TPA: peptidylprolyl isomerase [Anaerolineae bacterium]|nr:peptidylprolyl isomerase [Anaerolineae bacterium]HQK15370.1 peptidylprolyl isomerase [Anaerolineae bacterium]